MSPLHGLRCAIVGTVALTSARAIADVVAAEPEAPIEAPFPEGEPPLETQVVLQLVVGASGHVESAVVTSRAPPGAPESFDAAALKAAMKAPFRPSTRDGRPLRSRVEYVVVFHPPADAASAADRASGAPSTAASPASAQWARSVSPAPSRAPAVSRPVTTDEQDEDYAQVVQVRGKGWSSPRGLGDLRVKRELLDASPRQQTSEMLSAAPGFFVDHEDGEGIGNDVFLRGFDLEHGSGIEMRVGNIPINSPVHVAGQGYADANFIIPEVVRSIRVLEGPYDPRQGDSAIVGSAYFDLGVPDRGSEIRTTYGSFNQARVVGIAAPEGADEETFAAFSLRNTDGFGENRASQSASMNAQYGFDAGVRDHVRLLATAYGVRASLAGVVRQNDVDAGLVGFYDSYPYYAQNQGVQSSRVIVGADFDHVAPNGSRFEFAPWAMFTDYRTRQNFSGNIYSSELDPELAGGQGDLWEAQNRESAAGATSRFHAAPWRLGPAVEATVEPGVYVRAGHTDQTKSLLRPDTLVAWDRRLDAGLDTLDTGAYVDLDLRFWKRLRLSGGVRADLLHVSVDDHLGYDVPGPLSQGIPGSTRATQGIAAGPRVTAEYNITPGLSPVVSYGEGFRSLDATANAVTAQALSAAATVQPAIAGAASITSLDPSLHEGASPYSKVRSAEAGFRARSPQERYTVTLSAFETWVANELVAEATSGGFATEGPSVRQGIVGLAVAKPFDWLLASVAGSVSSATFTTLVVGVSHYVPNVPPVLLRVDVTVRGTIVQVARRPLNGRIGAGYTFLAGRHLTDAIVGPSNNVLNAGGALRYANVELSMDAFNVLNLRYSDDEEYYVSNWSVNPGTARASSAIHSVAAPPLTLLGTLALYF